MTAALRQIQRDVPIAADLLDDRSIYGRQRLVSALEAICRRDRAAGLARSWTYDIARHRRLLRALDRERSQLISLERHDTLNRRILADSIREGEIAD